MGAHRILIATLAAGEERVIDLGAREAIVIPLAGGVRPSRAGGVVDQAELAGRESVWAGPATRHTLPAGGI